VDPLITNAVDPALIRVLEKRGDARETPPRRKPSSRHGDRFEPGSDDRPEDRAEDTESRDEAAEDAGSGEPKHALDDLA
jgi:hypothetical protein